MKIFRLSRSGSLLRKALLVIGSALFISAGADSAKSAIFTVEYSGTVDFSSSTSNNAPDQTGHRIFGRYTFDDANDEVILSRYKLLDPISTSEHDLVAGLDPVKIGEGERIFRQTIPPTSDAPRDVMFRESLEGRTLELYSLASKESASLGEYRGILFAGIVVSRDEFYVDEQIFSRKFSIGDGLDRLTTSGQIDTFRLVDNVTPDIETVPTIPTDFFDEGGTDIPEPATALGLIAFAGVLTLKKSY